MSVRLRATFFTPAGVSTLATAGACWPACTSAAGLAGSACTELVDEAGVAGAGVEQAIASANVARLAVDLKNSRRLIDRGPNWSSIPRHLRRSGADCMA